MCSTASTVSSSVFFSCGEDDYEGEGEEREPPEMKYVPPDDDVEEYPVAKSPEDVRVKKEEVDEDEEELVRKVLEKEEDSGGGRRRPQKRNPGPKSRTHTLDTTDTSDDGDSGGDDDWYPSSEDEGKKKPTPKKGKESKRQSKRKTPTVKVKSEERRPRKKMSLDEKREKERVYKQQYRDKKKAAGELPKPKRKRVADMTPEQVEKERQRKRDYRLRMKMLAGEVQPKEENKGKSTPVKKKAGVKKEEGLSLRKQRKLLSEGGTVSVEAMHRIKEQRAKDRERKRARRAAMTPEERKEEARRTYECNKRRREQMTEEERREEHQKEYFRRLAKDAMLTPEEKRERNRMREALRGFPAKRKYEQLKETLGVEALREKRRQYFRDMSPTRRARYLQKLKDNYRKRIEKIKQDPEKWAEVRAKWSEANKRKVAARNGQPAPRRNRKCGNSTRNTRKYPPLENLTEEEKQKAHQRWLDLRRVYDHKAKLKKRLQLRDKLMNTGMTLKEILQQPQEKPEQRERRLMQGRIRKAKRELRKRLQNNGFPPEEIEKKVQEVPHVYTPSRPIAEYKPRPEQRKYQLPSPLELDKIQEELERLEQLEKEIKESSDVPPISLCEFKRRQNKKPKKKKDDTSATKETRPRDTTISTTTTQLPSTSAMLPPPQAHSSSTSGYHISPFNQQPPQQQNYSLQSFMHDTPVNSTPSSSQYSSQECKYEDNSATSSQYGGDYASSSYYDDDHDDAPLSPGENYEDNYSCYSHQAAHQPQQPTPSPKPPLFAIIPQYPPQQQLQQQQQFAYSYEVVPIPPKSRRGRPRKSDVSKKPSVPKKPRRRKKEEIERNHICDVCGQGYPTRESVNAHKNHYHHPSYDLEKRVCRDCGESFPLPHKWYTHYRITHLHPHLAERKKDGVFCEECGKVVERHNLLKHRYLSHGEGSGLHQCPFCPKQIKGKYPYHVHLRTCHPNEDIKLSQCARCGQSFPSDKVLSEHVKETHPESFFPCGYCGVCRYSQMGLHTHYHRCKNVWPMKGEYQKLRDAYKGGLFSVEQLIIPCELCGKSMITSSLSRHYFGMHKVKEDEWECKQCDKKFKHRHFWAAHLEEIHQKSVDQLMEIIPKLNATNREGMSIEVINTRKKGKKKTEGAETKPRRQRGRPKKKSSSEKEEEEAAEETETEEEEEVIPKKSKSKRKTPKKKKLRNVVVICEEDEVVEREMNVDEEVAIKQEVFSDNDSDSSNSDDEDDDESDPDFC